jgi:hypothetical protein
MRASLNGLDQHIGLRATTQVRMDTTSSPKGLHVLSHLYIAETSTLSSNVRLYSLNISQQLVIYEI